MERGRFLIVLATLVFVIVGCGSGDTGETPKQAGGITPTAEPHPGTTGMSAPGGPAGAQANDGASVKPAQAIYDRAKKAFDAAPKDEKAKKAYLDATLGLADANLNAPDLGPKEKYPAALKYYREVLKLDPTNEAASKSSKTIIQIYHDMGRPVPGGG